MKQVLIEQNPHWQGQQYGQYFERLHNSDARASLSLDEILIVTGIRRCGKSTLLKYLINELGSQYDPKHILYINFDDPNYTVACQDPRSFYDIVTEAEKLTQKQIQFLCLDEVQNVTQWEKYVKSIYDSGRFKKIIITGSNADLLKGDYANLLSGRYIETKIYPLNFYELLVMEDLVDPIKLIQQKAKVLNILDDMLVYGSFPRVSQLENVQQRQQILQSYYETILLKDCVSNHDIRDTKTLRNLAHYLISNNSTVYSYNSLAKAIGSNENTVKHFIQIFQDAYFIHEVFQFSYSLKAQVKAKKKTYCIDNGLITATHFNFMDNRAKLFENLVYSELIKCFTKDIYFHNDSHECDFIVHANEQPMAVQVCYTLTHNNRERELKGLMDAMKIYSLNKGLIITYDQAENISDSVEIVPFWQYFARDIF